VRQSLGQFTAPGVMDSLRARREREKSGFARALEVAGLLGDIDASRWSPALLLAAHRFLARTPSKLMLVAMEDVFGQVDQVNLPGTVDEYPNWRRKLERPLEEWARDSAARNLVDMLAKERPSPVPKTKRSEAGPGVAPASGGG